MSKKKQVAKQEGADELSVPALSSTFTPSRTWPQSRMPKLDPPPKTEAVVAPTHDAASMESVIVMRLGIAGSTAHTALPMGFFDKKAQPAKKPE